MVEAVPTRSADRAAPPQSRPKPLPQDARGYLLRFTDAIGALFGTEHLCLFLYSLVRMQRPATIVELGTGAGASAFWMSLGLRENGGGHLWAVDDFRSFRRRSFAPVMERLARGGFEELVAAEPGSYFANVRARLRLEEYLTRVASTIDLDSMSHFDFYPFARTPIDLLFSDFQHSPQAVLRILAHFLPRMSATSSIFIDSAATFWPSYLLLERLVEQFNAGKTPQVLLDLRRDLAGCLRNRRFTLVHLTRPNRRLQNGTSWLKIEPVDVVPYPRAPMRT
jgi:hypothetical protein